MGISNISGNPTAPLIRIITFGEFAIERLIAPSQNMERKYESMAWEDLHRQGAALAMLKALLCRPGRRASKQELIEMLWPEQDQSRVAHALDVAASTLRRHLLRTSTGESLLVTLRGRNETCFKLPDQEILWVDADEFLAITTRATQIEARGHNPLQMLEMALYLAQGEFLEDDLRARWSSGRRQTINGARHRMLYKLVQWYIREEKIEDAEEILFKHLEAFPTDEDALFQLVTLLLQNGRRHEALDIYHYVLDAIRETRREPSPFTQDIVRKVIYGHVIREPKGIYTASRTHFQLERKARSRCTTSGIQSSFWRHIQIMLVEHIQLILRRILQ